ncbi:lysine-specific demethylase JMJ17 isoform X1 [Cryptomeria japonica]|uniref:lysine-specific demethylase JMJ17 isoform X1 n=1 Tax=Cryptomeria japonica TaxID=3369 RepID=UPI0027DAB538|nr:lysine-specific demethylase JMJ17 isoform X1 [Cryptomeria japonica]
MRRGRGRDKVGEGEGEGGGEAGGGGGGGAGLNLPQAPVFYPSEEEFTDPLAFIEKIRGEAEAYGMCRIVPPKSWKPPFALDMQKMAFPTKMQALHHLSQRPSTCDADTFHLDYARFMQERGQTGALPTEPSIQGQRVDLCQLYNAVKRHGGFRKVLHSKKWGEVARILNPATQNSPHYNSLLTQLYKKHLRAYEIYQMRTSSASLSKCNKGRRLGGGAKRRRTVVMAEEGGAGGGGGGKRRRSNVVTEEKEVKADQICEQCKSGQHEEVMLLCDRCDRGWHVYCLSPPLKGVPQGNWYCFDCLNSESDTFGFTQGDLYSLRSFRAFADRFKRKCFGTAANSVTHGQIEDRFWEIVERSGTGEKWREVEVMYGSDLDTSLYGSGFPRSIDKMPDHVDPKQWEEHIVSPWNLNNFPKLQGSMLRLVHDNIAGVMVPWLYVGMLFSSFCWHFEDHCFYSINYLHWGEPKCWYSVPGSAADAFEQVMRKTFPDLFEAQPDLLFQLVTMLNPTVLKRNGVPVFTTLQESGNFVITFPRSFHGGFNCGLNCAEAVNFAPEDWLPHGGFGAELYRLYHKPAVLSHDELLCVVAKSGCSKDLRPFLKEELVRVIKTERIQRERLWRNGVVRISRMTPRKNPEYVGTEEDPECVICRYYLHLSAVTCCCRPGALVCLQHAERLCECNPEKQCLLYRYSMAELDDLLLMEDEQSAEKDNVPMDDRVRTRRISGKQSCQTILIKKILQVQGRSVTHRELAEAWLASARNILCNPISEANINDLLKEAEQFLWAGHEMDLVRSMEVDLRMAQKWSQDLRDCLSTIKSWMDKKDKTSSKVPLSFAQVLIGINPVPCIEPGFLKLKAMVEDASLLEQQIKVALSSSSPVTIEELKDIHFRMMESPFKLAESETLDRVIDSAKDWLVRAEECLFGKQSRLASDAFSHNINMLHDLQSEGGKIPVVLPEMALFDSLIKRIENWRGHARELISFPMTLEELNATLQDAEQFNVIIPELELLRQYKHSALSWMERCHNILDSIHKNIDYSKAVEDLTALLAEGRTLKVQVEDLGTVELELRNFLWREKASKALGRRLPLRILEELAIEASRLQLPNEKLVIDVNVTVQAAYAWEQSAKKLLCSGGCISEFKDLDRTSEGMCVTLPTFIHIKDAILAAEQWLENAKPFLDQIFGVQPACRSHLSIDALKGLLHKSELLKITLKESQFLRKALKNVEEWCTKAVKLLESGNLFLNSQNVWNVAYDNNEDSNSLMVKVEELIGFLNSFIKSGMALGFELNELTKLKEVSAALTWNLKALSFSSMSPSLEDVNSLIDNARNLPIRAGEYKLLESSLLESKQWLSQACLLLPDSNSKKKCNIQDLEDLVANSKKLKISFPMKVGQIEAVISNYRSWQKEVQALFNYKSSALTWPEFLKLMEAGESSIVEDGSLRMLASKVADIENWILHCKSVTDRFGSCSLPLQYFLLQIKESLDRALRKFQDANAHGEEEDCLICNGKSMQNNPNTLYCQNCKDRYHSSCLGLKQIESLTTTHYVCPFCTAVATGSLSNEEVHPRVSKRNCPTIDDFVELLNEAKGLSPWTQEVELVHSIVECAMQWQSYLRGTISNALVQQDKDSSFDSRRLVIALKTIEVVKLQDQENTMLEVALCTNSWRSKAKALVDGATKPSLKHIRRVLKEGLCMQVSSKDYYLKEMMRIERISSQWAAQAKQVVADHGALELDEVFKFIAAGERLPVDFRKELAALKVRSVLYCICRKPYDEERAMIACDSCNEWYHFDCLYLQEPVSSSEDCELLLQQKCGPMGEFICPVCKPTYRQDSSSFHVKVEDDDSEFISEEISHERDGVTPSFEFTRGKRRSRTTGKARSNLQERIRENLGSNCLDTLCLLPSDTKIETDNPLTATGRPCRRTAGQHSKFESFVLLTHTR